MIDYCTARMAWDLDLGWTGCLDHVTSALEDGAAIRDLLVEVGKAQVEPMRNPAILAMLVGSDDETEAAELAGIEFHPLPPPPADVLGWDDERAAALEANSVAPLPAMAAQYAAWADAADALAAKQSPLQQPIVAEIGDGLRITGLRLAHSHQVYSAVLGLRAAIRANDFAAIDAAAVWADQALATTEAARAIVHSREEHYRYPKRLTTDGDEPGTPGAIPNATIYPYRYLSRTHRMFYWTRPDEQLDAMFGFDLVTVNDRILREGTALEVGLLANMVSQLMIDWGDGSLATALETHVYAAQGFYDWTLDALHEFGALHHEDKVAVVSRRFAFPKGSIAVLEPSGASLIEGLLPGFIIGFGDDAAGSFLALGRVDVEPPMVAHGTLQRRTRSGGASVAGDLTLALKSVGVITVYDAVVSVADGTGPTARALTISGELSTDEIVDLVVATGGFDAQGAKEIVATTLGYTVETLPARLPMTLGAVGSE